MNPSGVVDLGSIHRQSTSPRRVAGRGASDASRRREWFRFIGCLNHSMLHECCGFYRWGGTHKFLSTRQLTKMTGPETAFGNRINDPTDRPGHPRAFQAWWFGGHPLYAIYRHPYPTDHPITHGPWCVSRGCSVLRRVIILLSKVFVRFGRRTISYVGALSRLDYLIRRSCHSISFRPI